MMTKEGRLGAVVLVLGCCHIGHLLKMHNFFKKTFSLLPGINQTNYVYSNNDQERFYQNFNFHDPLGSGSCARARPHKSLQRKCIISSLLPYRSDKLSI